jgi:MSHA biogenesis protein MshL
MYFKVSIFISACLFTMACQTPHHGGVANKALDQAIADSGSGKQADKRQLVTLPDSVNQALQPNSTPQGNAPLFGEKKYDINAQQLPARVFFQSIVQGTPYSVAIHPEVEGEISLDLKQVSLSDAFALVSDLYGYEIQRKQNIYRVFPSGLRTQTFAVNYLLMIRQGITQTSITSGGVSQVDGNNNNGGNNSQNGFSGNSSQGGNGVGGNASNNINGTNIFTNTETDFWRDLLATLESMIGSEEGKSVAVTPQAGLVTVRAMPDEIRAIKAFLDVSEEIVQRQVILEARIIEVSLNDGFQQGINWGQILANSGSTDFQFSTNGGSIGDSISATLGNVTSLSFINKDFSGVLSLLSTQGNVQVLSSPRVTATNNQKAVIKVGDDEYFVTDVSSQSTISASATSITPNIELTPFFSGIALDVTPQINKHGEVMLHVHPSVIETEEQEKVVTLNQEQFVLPLAQSNIRESDTVIRAKSGEIVVIGGLMQSITSDSESRTPIIGEVPILGHLFKSKRTQEIKKELVILIKPTVVKYDTWKNQLDQSREHMADWLLVE